MGKGFCDCSDFGACDCGLPQRPSSSPIGIKPLHNRVVVRPAPPETTIGGIILPDTVDQSKGLMEGVEGTVLAVGPGFYENGNHIAMSVKVGDRILFFNGTGLKVPYDGEELIVMLEPEIFAVMEPESKLVKV